MTDDVEDLRTRTADALELVEAVHAGVLKLEAEHSGHRAPRSLLMLCEGVRTTLTLPRDRAADRLNRMRELME